MKRLRRSALVQAAIASAIAFFIRLVYRTTRWTYRGFEAVEALEKAERPYIACCWHGRMLLMCCVRPRGRRIRALVSHHGDGQVVANVMQRFGVGAINGSTGRGGYTAIQGCQEELAKGAVIVITPDGPRGPGMQAAAGAIRIARKAGVPIIPVSYSTQRRYMLDTWDRFLLPLPFGRGVFICGAPLDVSGVSDDDAEEASRLVLQDQLNALGREADRMMGHEAH